jgi:hypothetical protein
VKLSTTVNGTLKVLILTTVASIKLKPSIVTNVPAGPDVGLIEVIDGLVDLGPCAYNAPVVKTRNVLNNTNLKKFFINPPYRGGMAA